MIAAPSIEDIRRLQETIGSAVYRTPLLRCTGLEDLLAPATEIFGKLEFLQRTGTFKARGALASVSTLTVEQKKAGITAVSAGNHAIATAYAAQTAGISAKVVMVRSANPARIAACRRFGAEIVQVDTVHEAFSLAGQIERQEGRFLVHPFEGPAVATGTGMIGLEIHEQCPDFDALVVSVGGGGLIGGVASAVRQLRPGCEIIGVEPEGADSMRRSFAAGRPQAIESVRTIADSLGAPYALPYSFKLCRDNVDQLVTVSDEQIREAMGILYHAVKIAVEPACAATTAAVLGPLRERLRGRKCVLVMCGSNIDWPTFATQAILRDAYAAG
ncbi:MAG: threonine/serine dehydratase [Gammaproteobacteria bacterium]|nr:threonine/serine dehydratase [Gammaproteobacteria bacterium]MDH5303036.1 threonine/serine dehydratase [Gammaproteobacteria bacterium]MDH5321198.1 threonine/serine dehydratase [Gammaproteobacteria bacterium]